jgi:Fic family protein
MVLVWKPITDLPEDWSSLTDGELKPLLQFWNDQRAELEQSGALAVFSQRLAREWSIETGQIEGVYNLDRGITQTLIERGINADLIPAQPGQKPPELIAAIIQDHADVLEGLFQFVRGERPLSKSYIHELHAALMRHQETTLVRDQFGQLFESKLLKGKYKDRPNNPQRPDGTVYEFCPPNQVEPEMERLLAMHAEHEKRNVPLEVEAAWLHHRFTQIHPYQDGNGRVARALASLFFIKAGWFPVVVTRDDRPRYLDSLELADAGHLRPVVSLLVDVQKRALYRSLQVATDVLATQTVEEAIAAAKKVLTGPAKSLDPVVWEQVKITADRLMGLAGQRLMDLSKSLKREIGKERPDFQFIEGVTKSASFPSAQELDYVPNRLDYHRGRVLLLSSRRDSSIEIQAHAIGSKFRGLVGIVAVFSDDMQKHLASKEPFQVNYAESYENAERRFRPWLEESLVNALTLWRKSL